MTWTLAANYFPNQFQNWPTAQYWIVGGVTAVLLFASVILHELGHSVVARAYGVDVRRITLFIFGGVAELTDEPPKAIAEFWIAIAGPVVSLVVAGIFFLLQNTITGFESLLALTQYLSGINAALALFNLIPGFPLDGGRVLRAVVWGINRDFFKATRIAATVGRIVGFGFIAVGVFRILGGNFANGMWIAFIGWFLESAAARQVRFQQLRDILSDYTVSQVMTQNYAYTSPDTKLQDLIDHQILRGQGRSFIVRKDGQALGLLTVHRLREVPREKWPQTTAGEAMLPVAEVERVKPDTELWEAFQKMGRDGVNQLPVMSNGHVEGVLSRDSAISFLRTVQELRE